MDSSGLYAVKCIESFLWRVINALLFLLELTEVNKVGIKVDTKGLEDDIIKYMRTFSKAYAKEGSKQITKKAQSCIEMFYRDYTPKYYDRTYDLKNNSYVPYYHDNGKSFYGGVRITADYMRPYYSGGIMSHTYTDPLTVAQLAWHGWHGDPTGYNGRFDPIRTTPPLDVLTGFVHNETFLDLMYKYAEKKATKQKYKYLDIK